MGILKVSEVKSIIKENGKQGSKDFIERFNDAVRRLLFDICKDAPKKRLVSEDVDNIIG